MNAVEFQGVSKSYAIYDAPGDRLKELLSLNRLKRHRDFWALHEVTFEVRRGETFCIVGENGSGKSTLLQMVAGILHPTSGTVGVHGRVSALLELGAGFNPEFSGRDNVYLNGSILGLGPESVLSVGGYDLFNEGGAERLCQFNKGLGPFRSFIQPEHGIRYHRVVQGFCSKLHSKMNGDGA